MKNKCYSKIKCKSDRCDIIISDISSSDDFKPITLSIRNSVDEWLHSFDTCIGKSSQVKIINQEEENSTSQPDLTLDLSKLDENKRKNQENQIIDDHNIDEEDKKLQEIDLEITKRLKTPPPRRCCFTESVYIYYPGNVDWVKRMLKLDSGIIYIYSAIDNEIVLQGMIYLAGCSIIPLNSNQEPLQGVENMNLDDFQGNVVRIHQTRHHFPILSKYSPEGENLNDFFDCSYVDLHFLSPSLLQSSVDTIQRAIRLNVAPLESLVPLSTQLNEIIHSCDLENLQNSDHQIKINEEEINLKYSQLNLLLKRYFKDIKSSSNFKKLFSEIISKKINKLNTSNILVSITKK